MPTINLLPPGNQRLLAFNRYRSYALGLLLVIMVALSLTYFASYYARYRIARQSALLTRQLHEVEPAAKLFDSIAKDAGQLATDAKEVVTLTDKEHDWPVFFTYIEESLPSDVYITSLSASPDKGNYTVIISGVAANRTAVGLFREKLLQDRVSQVVIDSITSSTTNSDQLFSIRVTMNIEPHATP